MRGDDVKVDPTKGLQRPDDIYSKNLSKDTANMIHATMEREQVKDDYEDLLRSALIESQKETAQLYSKNLVSSDVLENTPDYVIDDYEENVYDIDNTSMYDVKPIAIELEPSNILRKIKLPVKS